jgi:hypothetical protein
VDWTFKVRALERVLIVCGGILSLVLGYLLFVKGVSGEASLIAEFDRTKIQLINALPGIFFALFGAVILIFMARSNIKATLTSPENSSNPIEPTDGRDPPFPPLSGAEADANEVMKMLQSGKYQILHIAAHGLPPEDKDPQTTNEEPNKAN